MVAHGLYDKSPSMKRGEDGKMAVKKSEHKEGKGEHESNADNLEVHTDHEIHAKHGMDRNMIHSKHEHEHAMHKGGDKKEMHTRHQKEVKEMHTRHEKEHGATSASNNVGEPIDKIEKETKS